MDTLKKYGLLFERPKSYTPGLKVGGVLAEEWEDILRDGDVLRLQREALGYTQQEVSDLANITLRQYQRFELCEREISSSSFRIGLNICRALKIDPMYFCHVLNHAQ